eukprot:scaffold1723_cov104-Isochrysis_galbana.AAC.2
MEAAVGAAAARLPTRGAAAAPKQLHLNSDYAASLAAQVRALLCPPAVPSFLPPARAHASPLLH